MSLSEIEAAIKTLPKEELARFDQWYQSFLEGQWDEQIAAMSAWASSTFCSKKPVANGKWGPCGPFREFDLYGTVLEPF